MAHDQGMQERLEAVINVTPFARVMGARVTSIGGGAVEFEIDVKPELMHQHHGFVHGAVVGFMADSACAWAAASVAGDVVTSEYKLNLLAPAVGEQLLAKGRVVKSSGRVLVALAEVFALRGGEQTLVAMALASVTKVGGEGGR
ncbi:hypothetical protein Pres01_08710 [Metapseudomonas resinovorans]|uniref:PaaI family thioesterase n=1 Tax=Metapseudomonas resinovorans TaxID=53412 RepID=UPI00098638B3|nr:PaaI family thioesterase [Pseudomonas resinovorans]GLZ84820.1 hypothetical protein Pres01_08710 [Pseudomonas resinovorans]